MPDNGKRKPAGRRKRRGQGGFTLLETLVALMAFGMVASILYAFLLMGVSTYQRIETETKIRRQGDLLVAGIVSELMDAVHVEQGSDLTELIVVKAAADPNRYVDTYRIRMESVNGRHGVTVYKEGEPYPERRFELAAGIRIDAPGTASVLQADGNRAANVRFVFVREDAAVKADESSIRIDTRVPLSRLE